MRMQFTLRWLLVLVAISAFVCWMFVRRDRFLRLARYHESKFRDWDTFGRSPFIEEGSGIRGGNGRESLGWHATLVQKYTHAARVPWFPLPPDPDSGPFLLDDCIKWRTQNLGETPAQARAACLRVSRPRLPNPSPPHDKPPDHDLSGAAGDAVRPRLDPPDAPSSKPQ